MRVKMLIEIDDAAYAALLAAAAPTPFQIAIVEPGGLDPQRGFESVPGDIFIACGISLPPPPP